MTIFISHYEKPPIFEFQPYVQMDRSLLSAGRLLVGFNFPAEQNCWLFVHA